MAAIDDLINQIEDKTLRERLQQEVKRLGKQKKFGLVFEEHIPECTPLYDIAITKGSIVAKKAGKINELYKVIQITDNQANCVCIANGNEEIVSLNDLVTVARFGEPIYPSLLSIDKVENAPDSDLWHTLIEADNYHALQLLEYLYPKQVDCIYIDPPYNTGARDWKYNNDFVDSSDSYRHSKWLSMMEKRLKIAKRLLNPNNSVLICTIDEKEYLHLGCLLEEMFPEARIQMISSVINPSGVSRSGEFYRTDEYIYFVKLGLSTPVALNLSDEWITAKETGKDELRWRPMRRQGSHDTRREAANQFYPIFLSLDGTRFLGVGETLPFSMSWKDYSTSKDKITIWPLKPDNTEGCWQISQDSFNSLCKDGYTKISYTKKWGYVVQYLAAGERKKVQSGQFPILGRNIDGSIITDEATEEAPFIPGTQWRIHSHSAREFGSTLINSLFLDKRFSFPKSLYATHDAIRFFVADKPNAVIVDFFAGSGTTLHAVNLLNAEDGGHRRCILVTNNEVSDDEAKSLRKKGYNPGDEEWEKLGIARYVTWPRTVCSIEGHDVNGKPLKGDYLANDQDGNPIPMADGFKANCEYFKLGFLDKNNVALGRQFKEILPLLWLKAGAVGERPEVSKDKLPSMLVLPENKLAILIDETGYMDFKKELGKHSEINTVFIVTDSEKAYLEMISDINVEHTYQLYRSYLDNFRINARRQAR